MILNVELVLIELNIVFENKRLEYVRDAYEILSCGLNFLQVRNICIYKAPFCNLSNTVQLIKVISNPSSSEGQHVTSGDFNLSDINWFSKIPSCSFVTFRFLVSEVSSLSSLPPPSLTDKLGYSALGLKLWIYPRGVGATDDIPNAF